MSHLHPSAIVATHLSHRNDFTLMCIIFLLLLYNIQGKPFVPIRFFNYHPLSLISSHELSLEDDHYISFICQFSSKKIFNGHFSFRASLWNTETAERNIVTTLACARLLLSLWQSGNETLFVLAVVLHIMHRVLKKCQAVAASYSQKRLIPTSFLPFFCPTDQGAFVLVRSSRCAGRIKVWLSLSQWMGVEGESQLGTFPAVFLCLWHICCDIPTTTQAWFWPDGELSLSVNLICQLTISPRGPCVPGFGPPQSTYIWRQTM